MITFYRVQPEEIEIFALLAKWDNDPTIAELFRPNFSCEPLPTVSANELQQQFSQHAENKQLYLIKANHQPIGYISLEANFFMLQSQPDAAWISLCIGEANWRGQGIGKQAIAFIEAQAKMLGFPSIELGVFAYNIAAQRLYTACGYTQFAQIPNFIWYQGQQHADLRLQKLL